MVDGGEDVRDAVIVGAGPAGSVTAALLARAGHDVLLLDRATFPRSKPCGESINPGAVRQLADLGLLPRILSLPHDRIGGWRIHPITGPSFEGRYPEGEFGIAMDRAAFDAALLEMARQAGARVETGVRVTEPIVGDGRATGVATADGRRIPARLVVGADGLRSVVVRRMGLVARPPRLRKIAITAHVAGADLPAATGVLWMTEWGCIGIAPLGEGDANVVLVIEDRFADMLSGDPEGCFDQLTSECAYLRSAVRASAAKATGPFDVPTRAVATAGVILVGDAAGYFDPLTGQGIHRALLGARIAASVADECLRSDRVGRADLRKYEKRHRRAFGTGATVQRLVDACVAHPAVFAACAGWLRARPRLADQLVALTGDIGPTWSPFSRPTTPIGRQSL